MSTDISLGLITAAMAVLGGVVSIHPPKEGQRFFKASYIAGFCALGAFNIFFVYKKSGEEDAAQQNLVRLSTEAINSVTGGDNFCWLGTINHMHGVFAVFNQGKYPLYDLKARVVDVAEWSLMSSRDPGRLFLHTGKIIQIGDLAPSAWIFVDFPFKLPKSGKADYNIFFTGRNGFWDEQLKLRLVKGEWLAALRVDRSIPGRKPVVLMKPEIADHFPGPVNWGENSP